MASFNVLNFFNGNGAGGGFPTTWRRFLVEFARQKAKIVARRFAVSAPTSLACRDGERWQRCRLGTHRATDALTATSGCGTWTYVPNPSGWGDPRTDEIRPALICRTTALAPVGASMSPNNSAFNQARAPCPTFSVSGGASAGQKFSVIVNHFKSRAAPVPAPMPIGATAGANWNAMRKGQATALLGFITTVQAAASDLTSSFSAISAPARGKIDRPARRRPGGSRQGDLVLCIRRPDRLSDHAMATPEPDGAGDNAGIWNINSDDRSHPRLQRRGSGTNPNCVGDLYLARLLRTNAVPLVGPRPGAGWSCARRPLARYRRQRAGDAIRRLLLLRYLFGYRDAADDRCDRCRCAPQLAQIAQHIADTLLRFDVDGDGQTLALTDGVMILRRMLGITGATVNHAGVKNSSRSDADVLLAIDALKPRNPSATAVAAAKRNIASLAAALSH